MEQNAETTLVAELERLLEEARSNRPSVNAVLRKAVQNILEFQNLPGRCPSLMLTAEWGDDVNSREVVHLD